MWMNPPRVVIGPEATVEGSLRFDQDVKLYVSDRAHIGPVSGAAPIYFSGERPGDEGGTATAWTGGPERPDGPERP